MIDSQTTANALSALSHPSRVDIFKCLLSRYPTSLNAGFLSTETTLAPSTLSHHLREMEKGGVIKRTPKGRSTTISLDLKNLTGIANSLMQLCCSVEQTPEKESQNDIQD